VRAARRKDASAGRRAGAGGRRLTGALPGPLLSGIWHGRGGQERLGVWVGGAAAHLGGGTGFHHFAAFFDKAFRENDYLWGRLDGTERLLSLLLPAAEVKARADEAFDAILTEETPDLPTTAPLVQYLRTQL